MITSPGRSTCSKTLHFSLYGVTHAPHGLPFSRSEWRRLHHLCVLSMAHDIDTGYRGHSFYSMQQSKCTRRKQKVGYWYIQLNHHCGLDRFLLQTIVPTSSLSCRYFFNHSFLVISFLFPRTPWYHHTADLSLKELSGIVVHERAFHEWKTV